MIGKEFSDEARRQWFADKEAKRDAALRALATETNPKMQRKLRASARRYKAIIAMGPERTRAASLGTVRSRISRGRCARWLDELRAQQPVIVSSLL